MFACMPEAAVDTTKRLTEMDFPECTALLRTQRGLHQRARADLVHIHGTHLLADKAKRWIRSA
jgi:hypothetical protein